jgi:hypothetical protein
MAVKGRRVSVGTDPTALLFDTPKVGEKHTVFFKNKGAASVDVGGDDVATGEGYELEAGEGISWDIAGRGEPFAVSASSTVRVDVLESGA